MASEEDRLDQLLKAAQQQMDGIKQGTAKAEAVVPPQTEKTVNNAEIGSVPKEEAVPTSFDVPKAVQDEIFSASAEDKESPDLFSEEYQPSTENFPLKIFDEIPEEIYRKTIMADEPEEAPAAAVEDNTAPEEPAADAPIVNASPFAGSETGSDDASADAPAVSDDPNKMMSPDDIAALIASMGGGDEAPAEEPVIEEAPVEETPAPELSDDPNKMMSPDDIAALVASMGGGDEAPAEEPVIEEEPVEEAPAPELSDDPNKMMSPDDIAALVASMGDSEDAPAEELPFEDVSDDAEVTSATDDDPNKIMNPDDIASLVASLSETGGAALESAAAEEDNESMSQEEINILMGSEGAMDAAPGNAEDALGDDRNPRFDDFSFPGDDLGLGGDLGDGEDPDHMGLDEIEEKLRAAAADAEQPDPLDDDTDVVSILQEMGENDPDLSDLGNYLQKSDNNELLDNSVLEKLENVDMDEASDDDSEGDAEEDGGKKKKKKKEKKEKEGGLFAGLFGKKKAPKEKAEDAADDAAKEKKPGFFAHLLQILTTEAEDDTEVPEEKQTKLSEENEAILKEIDAEQEKGGKGKKKKEKKPKKPKKEKPPKPPKEKKPKKPKKAKPVEEDNSKKIPKKYIVRTFMLSFSILAAILVITMMLPSLVLLRQARNAYYEGDYKTTFLSMYGKELNESDRLIYERSRLLVMLDRKYESYENYRAMGMRTEALDALLQGVKRYNDSKEKATELNVAPEFGEIYLKIVAALNGDFGMSEEEAIETLGYSITDYTGKVEATANGQPYRLMQDEVNEAILQPVLDGLKTDPMQYMPDAPETPEETQPQEPVGTTEPNDLPDLLPEEQQYLQQSEAPVETQEPVVLQEIPVTQNNPAVGDASSPDANVSLQIESGQF